MDYLDLIIDKKNDINFLELKERVALRIGDYRLEGPVDLPIKIGDLLKISKDGIDDIPIDVFIDGIMYIFAVDPEFKYIDTYREILDNYTPDLNSLIMPKAIRAYDRQLYLDALVYLVAMDNLDVMDSRSRFLLADVLEHIDGEVDKEQLAIHIMNIYEDILNRDPDFELAYYKLGYIYKAYMQYLKSQLTFEEFLMRSEDDIKKQEVRDTLDQMAGSVALERAIEDMNRGDYRSALDKISQTREEQMTGVHYYHLSLIYVQLGDMDSAMTMINRAIDKENLPIFHNQRAIVYSNMNMIDKAIKELEDTIDMLGPDYSLLYNLATMYYNKNDLETALGNFQLAYELEPSDNLNRIIEQVKFELN